MLQFTIRTCCFLFALLVSVDATSARQPNFIIIFCDDLGYADIGPFGAKHHRTPNIDRMAHEGMRLTSFYSTCGVCSPSRSSLMTGCYPKRVGLHENEKGQWVLFPGNQRGLNPEETTIAEILKQQGYATAIVGKWHLGDQREFLPTRQGFDSYFGIPFSNDMGKMDRPIKMYPPTPLLRNETVIEREPDQRYITQRYTAEAVRFIETNRDKPFFLYLPHTMPHVPLGVSDRFRGKSRGGLYGDVIEEIDWSTGRILEELRELELDSRTLVVYTSDNGPSPRATGSALPLRGRKHQVFEGGMRVPCIVWGPGRVPAGRVCSEVATSMDLYPTFARLAGADLPPDRVIDGRDIYALMTCEPEAKSPYEAFFFHDGRGRLRAVRAGAWKLHLGAKPALYNLKSDIGEESSVAADEPETVERLRRLARQFEQELLKSRRPVGIDTGYASAPGIPVTVGEAKAADGLKVAYEVRGKGDVALVFIHGWASDRTYWHMQLDECSSEYRVVAVDLGGHGQSGSDRKAWSIEGLAGDVQAVTEKLGLKRWILIGHSMGGPVSLAVAGRTPGRTIGIVGVDTLHDAEFKYDKEVNDRMLDQFEKNFAGMMSGAVRTMFRSQADPAVVEWVTRKASSVSVPAVLAIARSASDLDLERLFSEARVPIRCINSQPGTPGTQETKTETNQKYADYKAVLIENTGHFPLLERPRRFNALLRGVLKELVEHALASEE